jgi:hypothetical protein
VTKGRAASSQPSGWQAGLASRSPAILARAEKTATLTGFEAGVVIDGGSANTVQNLTVRDNIGRDDPFNELSR